MTRITIDDALSTQLGQVGQPVEIFNSAGLYLGHFVPSLKPRPEDNCPYTAEEIAKARMESGGMTLEEFWKSIGAK